MIPILYESTETQFVSNGICRLPDATSVLVVEERNGEYMVDLEYPVTGRNFDMITLGRIIAVTHDDKGDIQPFDIVSSTKPIEGIVTFHAVHISYRQSKMVATGKNVNSLSDAFTLLSNAVPSNPFTYETDKTSTAYMAAAQNVPMSVRSLLGGTEGSILDTYGGEYEWDKFTVRLWNRRGIDRSFTIRYGVNMTEYNDETDSFETYNAVLPYWTGDDGKGNEVTILGAMQTSDGQTVTGRTECIPLDLSDKFEGKPTKADVESLGLSTLTSSQTNIPTRSISVSFVSGDTRPELAPLRVCRLCDTVGVVFPKYGVGGRFKIVKVEWDALLGRYNSMELGTLSTSLADALGVDSGSGVSSAYSIDIIPLQPSYTWTSGTPASGVTITANRWGQVVQVNLVFSRYATSAGGTMASGNISGIPDPIETPVRGVGFNGSAGMIANLNASGAVSVRSLGAITTSASSYCYFSLTYITAD